jgi:WD40 repeat protein
VSEANKGGLVRVWDTVARTTRDFRLEADEPVTAAALSPEGATLLVRLWRQTVRGWDVATGKPLGKALVIPHDVNWGAMAFSPDLQTVVASDGRDARLWSMTTGKPFGALMRQEKGLVNITFSPDGRTVATFGTVESDVDLWKSSSGERLVSIPARVSALDVVGFSPDGKVLLAGNQLWDVATGKPRGAPMTHRSQVQHIVFSPDGRRVLTACIDGSVRLWDAATGEPAGPAIRRRDAIDAMAFSRDGRLLAVGCRDGTVQLWVTATSRPFGPVLEHDGPVTAVVFNQDGRSLLVGTKPRTEGGKAEARLWQLPVAQTGDPEQITRELEVQTSVELDSGGAGRVLDAATWRQRSGKDRLSAKPR